MKSNILTIAALSLLLAPAAVLAQGTATKAADPVEAKFTAADADKSGFIDGKELDTYKAKLTMMDMNKDGKVSKDEFRMAVMTGLLDAK